MAFKFSLVNVRLIALPRRAETITLFCTGLVEESFNALSTVVLLAPLAMPSNLLLSEVDINPWVEVVASLYVVSGGTCHVPSDLK